MTVDAILGDVLRREGWPQFSDRVADKGGPTKGGITLPTLSAWRKHPCTVADLRSLDEQETRAIYRALFVEAPGFLDVDDERLRVLLVDFGVQSGPADAVVALQMAVGTETDGILGPLTLAALSRCDVMQVYRLVWEIRVNKLVDLALRDANVRAFVEREPSTQLANLRGWINRLLDLLP